MDSIQYYRQMLDDPSDYDKIPLYTTIKEFIFSVSEKYQNQIALVWNNDKVTYQELLNDALALSYFLKDKIKKGDNVGLVFANEYNFVKAFFACSILGLTCAIIPPSLSLDKLKGLANLFDLKLMLSSQDLDDEKNLNLNKLILTKSWSVNEAKNFVNVNPDDPACIVFTGGTTGNPKGAVLSEKNLCRGAFNGVLSKGKIFNIKYLSLIPFTHIFGLIKNLLSSLLSGSSLYLVTNPTLFAKEAAIYEPEILVLTPGLASLVLTLIKNYGINVMGKNFKTIIAGGANVPASLINEFKKFNINCFPGYGLTEATNLISGNVSIENKADSVGILYPHQEAKIVNHELYIKGDNVFLGYYKNPKATQAMFDGSFLKTGDLAHFDEDGYLYIDGRVNNLFVLQSGLKISPEPIENLIDQCPLVKDAIVRKDNYDHLFVEILLYQNNENNQNLVNDYINQNVNPKLDLNARITKVIFLDHDFKRTPAMKIIR